MPNDFNEQKFDYDIAISFLSQDEEIAQQLHDLISGRLRTFLYSKRQEELAGRDGEEVFNRVFGGAARAVVVLYRQGWGATPWTRIEETAIRNRAFDRGYDFVLFIPLDDTPTVPTWLPKTQIWFSFSRWGIEGAPQVIERLVEGQGGAARPETLDDKLARVARDQTAEVERLRLFESGEGVNRAADAAKQVFTEIDKLAGGHRSGLEFQVVTDASRGGRALYFDNASMTFYYGNSYVNSLRDARIVVVLWKGRVDLRVSGFTKDVETLRFKPDFDRTGKVVWRGERGEKPLSLAELIDVCVMRLVEYVGERRRPGYDEDDD